MTIFSAEGRARKMLPLVRLALGYLPLPVMRWLQSRGSGSVPAGVTRDYVDADGVSCEWIIPKSCPTDGVLLYLHGGGFVYGWNKVHRQMVSHLACQMGVSALGVEYRLAPEFPFPAALDDCAAAYRWLLKQGIPAHNIVIAGASAGGNLTLSTLLKLRDEGDPLPAAAACLSPVSDMTIRENADELFDVMLHRKALYYFQAAYVAHHDARAPLLSPLFADLHGLPPLLIHAGEDEFLREDAIRLADAAKQAGVEVELEIYPRMWHVWQHNLHLSQAIHSLNTIAQFLKARIEQSSIPVGTLETGSR
jgi:monoterpene epsilon-lactone hydrolase